MSIHLTPGTLPVRQIPVQARAANEQERWMDRGKKVPQALHTAWCALVHGHGTDHQLGRFEDTAKALGTATIATLGTWSNPQVGGAIPNWLGAASWLGAQALTPTLLNLALRAKAGISLHQAYLSSQGELRGLFNDPNYMPLQVIDLEKRIGISRKLNLDTDQPDWSASFQAKIRQMTIQARTWWMMMAGIATPVFTSVIADRAETWGKMAVSQLRAWRAATQLQAQMKEPSYKALDVLNQATNRLMGQQTEVTVLSQWWGQLRQAALKGLSLHQTAPQLFLGMSEEQSARWLAEHVTDILKTTEGRARFTQHLDAIQAQLAPMFVPLEKALAHSPLTQHLKPGTLDLLAQQAHLEKQGALATVQNLRHLLSLPQGNVHAVAQHLQNSLLAAVEQAYSAGHYRTSVSLAGGPQQFARVFSDFSNKRFGPAFQQMGESSGAFLLESLRSAALRKRWFRRFPIPLMAFMAVSTALFYTTVLGRDSLRQVSGVSAAGGGAE